jgi:hypothetical protein
MQEWTFYVVQIMREVRIKMDEGLAAIVDDYAVHLGWSVEEVVRQCLLAQLGIEDKESGIGDFDGVREGD